MSIYLVCFSWRNASSNSDFDSLLIVDHLLGTTAVPVSGTSSIKTITNTLDAETVVL